MKNITLIIISLIFSCVDYKDINHKIKDSDVKKTQKSFDADFFFVSNDKYLILSSSSKKEWAKGTPKLLEFPGNGIYSAITEAKMELIPSIYSNLIDKKINVCNKVGEIFSARITSLKLLSQFIPHFGQVETWNGSIGIALTNEQKAQEIFKSAALFLVAEFQMDNPKAKINNLYFATPSERPKPKLFPLLSDTSQNANIKNELSKIDEYEKVNKDYLGQSGFSSNKWWKDEEREEVFSLIKIKNGLHYATLKHVLGNPCGTGFYANFFSVWKLENKKKPLLLYIKDNSYSIVLVTDIDNDDIPEFFIDDDFGSHFLLKKDGESWRNYYDWIIPYEDCPC